MDRVETPKLLNRLSRIEGQVRGSRSWVRTSMQ